MKKALSFLISFLIALPSFVIPVETAQASGNAPKSAVKNKPASSPQFNTERDCPNANCVTRLSGLLEAKIKRAKADRCLPPDGQKNEQQWFETNTLSADCFKLVKEIEEDVQRLERIQAHFSSLMLQDEERMCRDTQSAEVFNVSQLADLQRASAAASCTEARKKEVWSKCASDATCVLVSTAAGMAGPLSKVLIPKSMSAQGCSGTQDNCLKQLALAFVKSVFSFFEGAWDLLKSAGKGIANQSKRFWSWVTDAEDKSSTAQLSAAQASEDEGLFQQLKNDFSGTMARMWTGLVASLKHWLANSVFCQKWSGTPQFSKCVEPAQGFGCTSCKAMITGMCSMVGVIASEVVPAFLTGGLVTLAKYGVSGASRVASLVKVSGPTMRALKNSRLAKMAIRPVARLTQKIVTSRFTQAGLKAMKRGVGAIGRFLISPALKGFRTSISAMNKVARASGTYVMMTPAGPVITFGKKAISNSVKVVLYPIENPMLVKSFQIGERFFDKIFAQAGKAKFFSGVRPILTGEAARAMAVIDDTYIEMKVTQYMRRKGSDYVTEAEKRFITHLRSKRGEVIGAYLQKKPEISFPKLVEDLYPELNYGSYTKHLQPDDIFQAEVDLRNAISKMPDGKNRERLMNAYKRHLNSSARSDILAGSPTFSRAQVIENAKLESPARIEKAFEVAQVDPKKIPKENLEKMRLAVIEAHDAGAGSVYNYNYNDIAKKYRILTDAGFSNKQSELLIRSGLAGKYADETLELSVKGAAAGDEVVETAVKITKAKTPRDFTVDEVLANAVLNDDERWAQALKVIERPVSAEELPRLSLALKQAHEVGATKNVFEYSWAELRQKFTILTQGGFSSEEAELLMRAGLAGRPPVRTLVLPGRTHFHSFAEDIAQGTYLKKYDEFVNAVKAKYSAADAKKILDNYESLFFIDYSHTSNRLLSVLDGESFKKLGLSNLYSKQPFENFQATRAWLKTEKPPVSKETLTGIHKRMMKNGVEGVTDAQMGKIRDGEWYGNVPVGYEIDAITRKNILDNPYLTWIEGSGFDGKYAGKIFYPNAKHVKKEALDLIRTSHPKTVKAIEEFQTLPDEYQKLKQKYTTASEAWQNGAEGKKLQARLQEMSERLTELQKIRLSLNAELVDALVDQQMTWFNQQRAAIGNIEDAASLDKFSNLVADLQRNLVSIHPVANGNGRSTREFMYYLFTREGLPPPRILDPNADIYKSAAEWQLMVKQGVLSTDQLVEDLAERLKYNLPIEHSMQLLTPYTRPPYEMVLKGMKNQNKMEGLEYVDPRIYREIATREMSADPSLVKLMESDPTKAWDKINGKVKEVFERNNLYYNHPKLGIERLELSFVDDDFLVHYGRASFDNPELYAFKLRNWYSDQIVWRGLASKTKYADEKEIIGMFKNLNPHMASNSVLRRLGSRTDPETIRNAALADFKKFNDDIFGEGVVQMARDHSETGPLYGVSYGYSTSKKREVGKAFAMGAMVVGEYGAHKAPELQSLLKSRVLVGAQRANKDIDLGRLKQLRQDFSYKYPRQQEVMGIGASDPDAIRIIQTINADGSVELTYLRNVEKPNEIFVIKGDIDPNAKPSASQIVKTISLSEASPSPWYRFWGQP